MIFWIFVLDSISHSWSVPMIKKITDLLQLQRSRKTCKIGSVSNTSSPHGMYILYPIPSTASCLCRSNIAHPCIHMYIFLFIPLHLCVLGSCYENVRLLRYYCMGGTRSTSISLHSHSHLQTMCMWQIKFDLIQDLYTRRCQRKAQKMIKDSTNRSHSLFSLLPHG